jgi:hypothetical protein
MAAADLLIAHPRSVSEARAAISSCRSVQVGLELPRGQVDLVLASTLLRERGPLAGLSLHPST